MQNALNAIYGRLEVSRANSLVRYEANCKIYNTASAGKLESELKPLVDVEKDVDEATAKLDTGYIATNASIDATSSELQSADTVVALQAIRKQTSGELATFINK